MRLAATVGKSVGRVGIGAARTVGIVLNVIMLPVDIAFVADAAMDLKKEKLPKLCEEYEKICKTLRDLMELIDGQMEDLIGPNGANALDGMALSSNTIALFQILLTH